MILSFPAKLLELHFVFVCRFYKKVLNKEVTLKDESYTNKLKLLTKTPWSEGNFLSTQGRQLQIEIFSQLYGTVC